MQYNGLENAEINNFTFMTDATPKWGMPVIDADKCVACGLCAEICPTATITMAADRPVVGKRVKLGCLACGHCMAVCMHNAILVTGRGLRPDDAFPLPPLEKRAGADALQGLLQARRSTRRYADRQVEQQVIDRLLEMAASAPVGFTPSAVGVTVINGKARVRELAEDLVSAMKKWLFFATPVGAVIMYFIMDKPTRAMMRNLILPAVEEIIEAFKKNQDFLFYDAPCVIIFHYPMKDTIDSTIACSYASIAAESLGLGSCMIGTVAPAFQGDVKLKAKWGIPQGNFPSMALIVGYPSVKFVNGVRRRFASVSFV